MLNRELVSRGLCVLVWEVNKQAEQIRQKIMGQNPETAFVSNPVASITLVGMH
jgi:hypothetical protein